MSKEEENRTKIKRRPGDRWNGYKVRTLPPMMYVTPFVMKTRGDASNYFDSRVDVTEITNYIRHKSVEEGLTGFGFMHVLIAAYVRTLAQYPALNRFVAGQRIFHRHEILLSMMVKKELSLNAQESVIRPVFDIKDTVYDVYNKMSREIEVAVKTGDTTNMDNVARTIVNLPAPLLRGFIGLMSILDYFGIMPKLIYRASPFHGSLFITNLGSLGIMPIYHHLYNFGDLPIFIAFGKMYRDYRFDKEGKPELRKYIDLKIVTDERITDGHYYANAFKHLEKILAHPELLDTPPETVVEDVK